MALQGLPAVRCPLESLDIGQRVEDASLDRLPTLRRLKTLALAKVGATGGRYAHTLHAVDRHRATLEHVKLGTTGTVDLAQPGTLLRKLPCCRVLDLSSTACTRALLDRLALCHMPALERLALRVEVSGPCAVCCSCGSLAAQAPALVPAASCCQLLLA